MCKALHINQIWFRGKFIYEKKMFNILSFNELTYSNISTFFDIFYENPITVVLLILLLHLMLLPIILVFMAGDLPTPTRPDIQNMGWVLTFVLATLFGFTLAIRNEGIREIVVNIYPQYINNIVTIPQLNRAPFVYYITLILDGSTYTYLMPFNLHYLLHDIALNTADYNIEYFRFPARMDSTSDPDVELEIINRMKSSLALLRHREAIYRYYYPGYVSSVEIQFVED